MTTTAERVTRATDAIRTRVESHARRKLDVPAGTELRLDDIRELEVRAADGEGPIGFKGLASVFDKRARIGGRSLLGWFEQIASGTFAESLESDDIRMLKNHNTDLPLARNTAGTLRLSESKRGLETDADMTPTSYARDLALSLEAGDVSQMSFGFEVLQDTWVALDDDDPDKGKVVEPELRVIEKVKLWEVSPVTFPAYVDTDASLRAADLETIVRSLGLDDEQLHEIARTARTTHDPNGLIEAVAKRLAAGPPAGKRNRDIAMSLFPKRIAAA